LIILMFNVEGLIDQYRNYHRKKEGSYNSFQPNPRAAV